MGKGTYRSDDNAIRPITICDAVVIVEIMVPEGDCGSEEDDAD